MCQKKNIYEWPTIATLVLFAFGLTVALRSDEPMRLYEWAQYWASLLSAGALSWLVFGYWQQGRTIDLQNENIRLQSRHLELAQQELQNQQAQLELQRVELRKMSFASSLAHIRDMINAAKADYDSSKKPNSPLYLNENIKSIFGSTDPREVSMNCQEWQNEYLPYQLFIKRVRDAAEFYFTSNEINYNKGYANHDTFLYVNNPLFSNIPYIADAYNSVSMQILLNSGMVDVPKQVSLAFFSAQWFLQGKIINVEQLQKDASEFTDEQLPAIYKELVKNQKQ